MSSQPLHIRVHDHVETAFTISGIRKIYFAHRAGYSYAEIADHMNISRTTIKRHIARALLAIMEHGKC
jgi:DNA-binding transcriptional regulator LsrR (DeoR family)